MPATRRGLLASATAGVAATAGCTGQRLPPVTIGSDPRPPAEATVVASDAADHDPDEPRGTVRLTTSVHQRGTGETARLFCLTACRLTPGQNQRAGEGWLLDELRVEHDYAGPLRPLGTATSLVPTDDDSPAARFGRTEPTDADERHEWTMRFPRSGDATWSVVVAAEAVPLARLVDDDPLLDVRIGVRETPRWGFTGETTTLGVELRYGDTETA